MSQVYVWDKFVRIFHWALVTLFIVSYLTGDEQESIHTWSGYIIFGLVLTRCLWGLLGSKYARFSEFVRNPYAVIRYLKDIVSGTPKRYLGHNPAGGAMVIAILLCLSMTTLSGMKLLAIEEGEGPFAQTITISLIESATADEDRDDDTYEHSHKVGHDDEEEEEEFWEDIHELFVNLMLVLITLHILGVLIASRQHNELLVRSMFSGKKRAEE